MVRAIMTGPRKVHKATSPGLLGYRFRVRLLPSTANQTLVFRTTGQGAAAIHAAHLHMTNAPHRIASTHTSRTYPNAKAGDVC